MFTNSHNQVSYLFTIIGLIAESILNLINDTKSKIFGNPVFEMKVVPNLALFLNTTWDLTYFNLLKNSQKPLIPSVILVNNNLTS